MDSGDNLELLSKPDELQANNECEGEFNFFVSECENVKCGEDIVVVDDNEELNFIVQESVY